MSKQRRHNGTGKGRRRRFDDEYDGGRDNAHRPDNRSNMKTRKRVKNEKVLLDLLTADPEAEEELISE